jgi:hypothetical protein
MTKGRPPDKVDVDVRWLVCMKSPGNLEGLLETLGTPRPYTASVNCPLADDRRPPWL